MAQIIKYYSTNHNSEFVNFREALLQGQAPDKGLYLPDRIPKISLKTIVSMKTLSYPEIAFIVTNEFLRDEIPEDDLKKITKEAYDFDIPLENVIGKIYIMRLDQGPTASFKDFAARMMTRLIEYFIKKENKNLLISERSEESRFCERSEQVLILVATSGDTGSAVANAFYNLKNIKVVVLFPGKEVSERQRKQMTTLGKNITVLAVNGKFDDCQAMVKQAFADPELSYLNLSSANSINFGRLLPQIVYYFYAYSKLAKKGEEVIFSVPSGNFGNLMGGLIAKKMGLPVYKFIAAVNENDEFPKFLETKNYIPIKPSKVCPSSAMNVGHPSNLARLINLYGGQMDEKGKINTMPDVDLIKKDIFSVSISNDETIKTIKKVYDRYKVVLEPHGAVGWTALESFLLKEGKSFLSVCLETAHPAKFPEEIEEIIGLKIKSPKSLSGIENKKEDFKTIPADYQEFKTFLENKF